MRVGAGDLNRHAGYYDGAAAARLEPNQRGHAPARGLAPVRKEARRASVNVQIAAALHRPHAGRGQRVAREPIEVGLPAAPRRCAANRRSGAGARATNASRTSAPDLVRRGADRGPEPGHELAEASPPSAATAAGSTPCSNPRQPACATPTRLPSRSQSTHRQAIRRQHGADDAGAARHGAVRGLRRRSRSRSSTRVPWTCSSQLRLRGQRERSCAARVALAATAAASSPTCVARFNEP